MQINVMQGADASLFTHALFPETSQAANQWIEAQFNRGTNFVSNTAATMFESAKALFQTMNNEALENRARSLYRSFKNLLHPNAIIPLTTVTEIQAAKPIMQRYMMAQPDVRELYHQQKCDGYSDSYVDLEPGKVGRNHYDYRRVMEGIIEECIDDNGYKTWSATVYDEDLEGEDRHLTFIEKVDILNSWDIMKDAISQSIDPTDIFGGKL